MLTAIFLLNASAFAAFGEGETYVFEEIRDYLVQDTYVADDGYIGIPMSVCTYAKLKPEQSTSTDTVVVYVLGYNGERIGTERDIDIICDLLDEGYVVITMDYFDDLSTNAGELLGDE